MIAGLTDDAIVVDAQRGGTDAALDRVGIARAINRADRGGQTLQRESVQHGAVLSLKLIAAVGKLFEAVCYRPRGRGEHGGIAQGMVTADADEQVTHVSRNPFGWPGMAAITLPPQPQGWAPNPSLVNCAP